MKVRELMTPAPKTTTPSANLAAVASAMWFGDCGAVPVVDGEGRVIGILTDRDICIALASKSRAAADVYVRELLTGRVVTCGDDDDVHGALAAMRAHQVRRLPVVDAGGRLVGIVSVTDALLFVRSDDAGAPNPHEVLETLRSVSKPHYRAPAGAPDAGHDVF